MSQKLDYASPVRRERRLANGRSVKLALVVAASVAFLNFLLVGDALNDRGAHALHIVFVVGPITNGILCVASFACTPLARRHAGGAVVPHMLASIAPVLAIFVDGLVVARVIGA
ncbi:MAG: hypothetical protein QOF78_111 [Phycisphaerales bacterium]|jgi:hypothetical protein|nr:hypothetical protein [Phycisphaerales bacterium]